MTPDFLAGARWAYEQAAKVCEAESEMSGPMPPDLQVLPIEDVARMTFRATRKAIARNIRSLSPAPEGGEGTTPPKFRAWDEDRFSDPGCADRMNCKMVFDQKQQVWTCARSDCPRAAK